MVLLLLLLLLDVVLEGVDEILFVFEGVGVVGDEDEVGKGVLVVIGGFWWWVERECES